MLCFSGYVIKSSHASYLPYISQPHFIVFLYFARLAQALASSFNFQGRVRKTFYVLSDDKVVAGVRRPPQTSQASKSSTETEADQPMETDTTETVAPIVPSQPPGAQSLAAKLSANLAIKRKTTEPPEQSGTTDKPKRG